MELRYFKKRDGSITLQQCIEEEIWVDLGKGDNVPKGAEPNPNTGMPMVLKTVEYWIDIPTEVEE